MSLATHIKVRTPLVWVVSDEPHRVTETVLAAATQPVYRLDAIRGLLVHRQDRWREVLVRDEHGNLAPSFALGDAVQEAYRTHGVLVVDHAHHSSDRLLGFYAAVNRLFLDAVRADDAEALPCQFVLISYHDQVPPELAREIVRVTYELPDEAALDAMLGRFDGTEAVRAEDRPRIVRAAKGLSEFEFTHICAEALATDGHLDPAVINSAKVAQLNAGGLLEVRAPSMGLDDIGGLDVMKRLLETTAWLWAHPGEAERLGVEPLRRVLLVGVPGSGKSAVCEAAASLLGQDLAKTGVANAMSKWVGESEANMRRIFTQIRAMAPITLWIDEFGRDASGGMSSSEVDGGTTDRVHGEFLTGLQELPPDVFLMAAANRIEGLPPEMFRKDRFDKIVFVGLPTGAERAEIFRIHLGDRAADHDCERLAGATPFFTGAEIKALIKETRFAVVGEDRRTLTDDDLCAAAPRLKGRVFVNHHDQVLNMYRMAQSNWDWASSAQEAEAATVLSATRPAVAAATIGTHRGHAGVSSVPRTDGEL